MRKTVLHFFTIADYEEEEIWLREQHKSGWKLVKLIVPCFYVFESCVPQDVIYRLDYKNAGWDEQYIQMAKDFGWEHFMVFLSSWLYFRKPADAVEQEEDGELFSDNASRTEMVRKIVKTRLLPLAFTFLGGVIPNLLNAVRGSLGIFSTFFGVFFGIMFVLYVFLIVHCGIKLKKIRDKYQC